MQVDSTLNPQGMNELNVFDGYILLLYRFLTYLTFNVIDDAAMLSLAFA
jgi:hypothetical protein